MAFSLSKESFKLWLDSTTQVFKKSGEPHSRQNKNKKSEALPFNALEFSLFAQNCFLYAFADEQDNNRLELLFSVAVLIFLYFFIIQTFFQSNSNSSNQAKESLNGSLFMSAIEELFDLEIENPVEVTYYLKFIFIYRQLKLLLRSVAFIKLVISY